MTTQTRVLIVEDEPGLAMTLAASIRQASRNAYEVLVCNNPQEALANLTTTIYDLVISDLRLPGISGLELIGRVKQKSPGTHTILMTGYGSQDVEIKAKAITDAYLTKPFDLPNVLALIQNILSPGTEQKPKTDVLLVENSLSAARKIMDELRFETKSPYAMLFYMHSPTIIDSGETGAVDKTILNASLLSSMTASNELAQAFNAKRAFDMHYYDGDRYEIHLRKVNAEIVLALLIDLRETQMQIGGIRLYLKRAVESIRQISDQLLAAEKGKSRQQDIESVLGESDAPDFFNALDDLLFSDEKPPVAGHPASGVDAPLTDEKPTRDYFSLD
jgi:CheY-like chemotaxis protein/predicted regulator of Ras-like GTPase activity (Roadblock/LC7/MglB family)